MARNGPPLLLALIGLMAAPALAFAGEKSAASPAGAGAEEEEEEMPDTGRVGVDDVYGYYLPTKTLSFGFPMLSYVYMGTKSEFDRYEGVTRPGPKAGMPKEAPVTFNFCIRDMKEEICEPDSEMVVNALVYIITPKIMMFRGESDMLGTVNFDGVLDVEKVYEANGSGAVTAGQVLKGDLQVGGTVLRDVAFTWFIGE
jgi:hypothetical protein